MAFSEDDKRFLLENFAGKKDLQNFATKEDLEDMETRLLTEFHKWASPVETRLRAYREVMHSFELEQDEIKRRIGELEKRL